MASIARGERLHATTAVRDGNASGIHDKSVYRLGQKHGRERQLLRSSYTRLHPPPGSSRTALLLLADYQLLNLRLAAADGSGHSTSSYSLSPGQEGSSDGPTELPRVHIGRAAGRRRDHRGPAGDP